MRVISKLAQIDFRFGRVTREGNLLVIESDKDARMPSTVYVSPDDVGEFLKRFIVSPKAILFVLGLPWFWWQWRKHGQGETKRADGKKAWPTV